MRVKYYKNQKFMFEIDILICIDRVKRIDGAWM